MSNALLPKHFRLTKQVWQSGDVAKLRIIITNNTDVNVSRITIKVHNSTLDCVTLTGKIKNMCTWYILFMVFIRLSQNTQHHNELSQYRLYGGHCRKHWIENAISKLIFNRFNFT